MEIIQTVHFGSSDSQLLLASPSEIREREADLYVADTHTAEFLSEEQKRKTVILPPGESEKNFGSVEKIIARAVEYRLDRASLILGIGGGVVTDMTAFAASLYMRGCRVELVPTSLLAMVDAAVGGKTGVDYGAFKNMIGTFYPAERVFLCPEFISSLPQKEYLCGMAEVIKTAILGDKELFGMLESDRDAILKREMSLVRDMIVRCVRFKGQIVEEDLKENGVRACLNLGHTFGHALESVTGFTAVSHGEGVAWGIGKAADAAYSRGNIDSVYHDRLIELLKSYGYRLVYDVSPDRLMDAMGHDKKIRGGQKRFILPSDPEKYLITPLDEEFVRGIISRP